MARLSAAEIAAMIEETKANLAKQDERFTAAVDAAYTAEEGQNKRYLVYSAQREYETYGELHREVEALVSMRNRAIRVERH